MKRYLVLLLLPLLLSLGGCYSRVPAGHVGVQYNKYGSNKGVDLQVRQPGSYWLSYNEEIELFPTFLQTYNWTQSTKEGNEKDESFTFQTGDGMPVNADVGITYQIEAADAPKVFQEFRRTVDEITDTFIRNDVRDQLVRNSANLHIDDMIGSGKAALMDKVQDGVKKDMATYGIQVDKVFWLSQPRLPQAVTQAINAKIQSTQMAEQRKNEVAQATAEGQKEVALAQARATATLATAEAEAKAITLKSEALKGNDGLIELTKAQRWNGVLPQTVMGGGVTPFMTVPAK